MPANRWIGEACGWLTNPCVGRLYASKVESDYQAFVRTQKERQ